MGLILSKSYSLLTIISNKTTVFKPGLGVMYSIPALIYLKETHTYLTFAENWISKSDNDTKCLVMRKGTSQNGANAFR